MVVRTHGFDRSAAMTAPSQSLAFRHHHPPVVQDLSVAGPVRAETLGMALLRDQLVDGNDIVSALTVQNRRAGRLTDFLLARSLLPEDVLGDAVARHWSTDRIDPMAQPADVRLLDRVGAAFCLRHGLLPWRGMGGLTVVATARPEEFERHRPHLSALLGPVAPVIATGTAIETAILRLRGGPLAQAAETRVAASESCRDLAGHRLLGPLALVLAGVIALGALWPVVLVWAITGWAALTLMLSTLLKLAAAAAGGWHRAPTPDRTRILRPPVVSVMVALYRESSIAPRLVRRLSRLDYPHDLLDIVLIVEEDDKMTRAALADADLPPWMRVVAVAAGTIKTKPRALNFALDLCRGSIIGVYDAEDAPEPDQISRVVNRFHQRGAEVGCLQGVLDFYNPTTNWLSRCFTIEYATWFRLVLPGLQRLGLPIPLGGTTLFFRRAALEAVGAWDAHNVTEDADLGIRLYRHGYRTELIDTVTREEANCRALPWVKQRSRWLKGYMMTWATHMRDPVLLWRQLGAWRFAGFQVLFVCTLTQFLLAPVLWSFWLIWLGLDHPFAQALPHAASRGLFGLFVLTESVNIALGLIALHRSRQPISRWWVLTLHLYFPLGALASYKAAWEVVGNPFYWDKTAHGDFDEPKGG